MEQMNLSICGIQIRISAPLPMETDRFGRLFLTNSTEHDLRLDFAASQPPALPIDAVCLREEREELVYRQGSGIYRAGRKKPGDTPFALLHYDLKEPQAARLWIPETDWQWATGPYWIWKNMALPQLLHRFGAMVLHGSFIEADGRAIIFTAPSGTGKSTQAALWEKHRGAVVCNGDKTGLRIQNGVLYAWGLPFCGTSDICRNVKLPVAAIVSLSQAPENSVTRLPLPAAIQAVMQNVYTDRCVCEEWQQAMNLVLDVVSHVPVLSLACTPDERAVEALEAALRGLKRRTL